MSTTRPSFIAVLGLAAFTLAAPALAQDTSPCCDQDLTVDLGDNYIPGTPSSGSDCRGICYVSRLAGDEFEVICDTTVGSGTEVGAKVVAVRDPPGGTSLCTQYGGGGTNEYCAFGEDAYGTDFYCTWSATDSGDDLTTVSVFGSGEGDIMQFWWTTTGPVNYNLEPYSGYAGAGFLGRQYGLGGNDELQGSRSTSGDYEDRLYGGGDADEVCGLTGDDVGDGGSGVDLVCGDDNLDTLTGGGDGDTVCGYSGNGDLLDGGTGNDLLNHGGSGGSDANDGGPGTDECNNSGDPNCESGWTSGDPCP